ncbi:hypothetical protein HK099_002114 [Clydaea vesicula]|uniref:Uncharacterized protein n=1 Tax=Clydaea vesicula TaxID=447962 RepID=A0AAD5XWV5_9FUNG|nr:hypothetical protein HK099_002114 [Clydaea vesicula]
MYKLHIGTSTLLQNMKQVHQPTVALISSINTFLIKLSTIIPRIKRNSVVNDNRSSTRTALNASSNLSSNKALSEDANDILQKGCNRNDDRKKQTLSTQIETSKVILKISNDKLKQISIENFKRSGCVANLKKQVLIQNLIKNVDESDE